MSLFSQRAGLIFKARQINDAAGGELSAEQRGQIGRIFTDVDRIETRMRQKPQFILPDSASDDDERTGKRSSAEYHTTYDKYLRRGPGALEEAEKRALQADNDKLGGYVVPTEQTADAVVKFVDDNLPIRQMATKLTVSGAQSLGVPSIDTDVDDADWTTELTSGSDDSGLKFGKRELQPQPVIKRIRVSNKLLRRAKNAEALVNGRLTFKLLLTFEKAYMTGSGAHRPLGVFTASTSGIST